MSEHPSAREDDGDAVEALLVASRALIAVAARSMAETPEVTLVQFRALVVLSRGGSVTVSDLAAALDVHPSTATRLCDRLVGKSLIRRRAGVAGDRRITALELAPKGHRLVERVLERRQRDLAAIASRMSPRDREAAAAGLRAFALAAAGVDGGDPFGWPEAGDPERVTSAGPR